MIEPMPLPMTPLQSVLSRLRHGWSYLLTKLNALGALGLFFVLENPGAPSEVIDLFPQSLQPIVRAALPVAWFGIVQFAKRRAVKHGK